MILSWFFENYIEVFGSIFGLIYLYFSIKQIIWLWPVGIISSLLYIFVFYKSKFYADMSLQVYYLVVSIYGWFYWEKDKEQQHDETHVVSSSVKEWFIFVFITFLLTVAIGYGLDNFTDSPLPYWDTFTTAGSIVATWMLARKYIDQWLFWIVVDFVSMGTYIYKSLYPTVILFAVYTVMAYIGYKSWKKDLKKIAA
jgi:nicotinamide mononucleotide transporter